MADLAALVRSEIDQHGPLGFADYMNRCLYDPDGGFYAAAGQAGRRRGDFITSVEVGGLFAAVIGDWLDRFWHQVGRPAPFRVSEAAAGVGTMWRGICAAEPACLESLTWTLVERSAALRVGHNDLPRVDRTVSAADLPAERQHVVLANELLDNLAVDIAERVHDGWAPVRVHIDDSGENLVLIAGTADAELAYLGDLVPAAQTGTRVPVSDTAARWVETATKLADHTLVFDYGATTAELAERTMAGWLRTYRDHQRGHDPLADPGSWDITSDVAIDQLLSPDAVTSQADWLIANGIADRVQAGRDLWHARSHLGDLAALRARSTVHEAEALLDPTGLGSFVVLEWSHP